MVTAELATALPVLVLLAVVGVLAIRVAQARVICADAAREAARAVARGDPGQASPAARAVAGRAVAVSTSVDSQDLVRVSVTMRLRPLRWVGTLTITDTAVAAKEPGSTARAGP
ncbi:hypothetical protein BH10ACT8_BH10ACT8_27800 [soil metagenome]